MTTVLNSPGDIHSGFGGGSFPFIAPCNVGDFLTVVVADAFGFGNDLIAATDTQGNAYTLDVAANLVDFDGSIYMLSSQITNDLTTSDSLHLTWTSGTWNGFYVLGTTMAFTRGAVGPSAAAGIFYVSPATVTGLSVTAAAGDLLVAYAAFRDPVATNDGAHGWTAFASNVNANQGNYLVGDWQLAPGGAVIYAPSTTDAPADTDGLGAAAICAYAPGSGGGGGGGGGGTPPQPGGVVISAAQSGLVARP